MPVMDGITLCQTIRKYEQSNSLSRIPIIGLTGSNDPELIKSGIKEGMNEVYIKPIEKQKLVRMLSKYLRNKT